MSDAIKKYNWMDLEDVLRAVPSMMEQGVSEVARGKKKSSQSKEGFVQAYIATDGDPERMAERSTGWGDQTWAERRLTFIRRHLRQMRQNDSHSDGWDGDQPTRRHLGLIAWAYTPSPKKTALWLKTQPSLNSGDWKDGVKLPKDNPKTISVAMHRLSSEGVHEKIGKVLISETQDGLQFDVDVSGLSRGKHGFHIHEYGNIEPAEKEGKMTAGLAAGQHYDPDHTGEHLGPYEDGHLGDLPYLIADTNGDIFESVIAPRLSSLSEIEGLSLIIHSHGDNYSDYPLENGGGKSRAVGGVITNSCPYCVKDNPRKNKMAAGYQSYAWTTQDWRSVFIHRDGSVSYDKKCGAKDTRLKSGKPRLCLPVSVIEELLETQKGTDILIEQARKKQRAKKGERVAWHATIKDLHRKLENKTVEDDPSKKRKNPEPVFELSADIVPIADMNDKRWFVSENHTNIYYHCDRLDVETEINDDIIDTVDPNLKNLVRFFHTRGIQTGASCQGHEETIFDVSERYIALQDDAEQIRNEGLVVTDLESGEEFIWQDSEYEIPFDSFDDAIEEFTHHSIKGALTIYLSDSDIETLLEIEPEINDIGITVQHIGDLDDGRYEYMLFAESQSEDEQADKWKSLTTFLLKTLE